eukprot:355913-Pyramimonas_sp.AAC.1
MQQTNAPDDSESVSVSTSSVALLNLRFSTENRQRVSRWLETADPAATLFGSSRYPIELRLRRRAGKGPNM